MPNVVLIPLNPGHIHHVMEWVNDPEIIGYFANRQTAISLEDELAYIRAITQSKTDRVWSVFDKDTGKYIGQCSINSIYWPAKNGRLFMAITKSMQKKGYSNAIIEALKAKAFQELGLHKIWLMFREENEIAKEHYLKAGFRVEGVLYDEYYVQDRWFNMVRMSLVH
jgi:RimJ/RimL family protein N-acetyltransferase